MSGRGVVRLGCEVLVDDVPRWFRTARMGLLANQASVTGSIVHVSNLLRKAGGSLCAIFSPQHGFYAEKQANMIESPDGWDGNLRVPVHSLYGDVRKPTPEMLEGLDVLLIDLQDVGTRVYTYGTTMGLCLEAAAECGLKVVVLDRPNPINGRDVEGNPVGAPFHSFVGRYPIPMRHGLTMGELARFITTKCGVDCDLEVIPVKGWRRADDFSLYGTHWVFPSPNMPSYETALVYPGMVLFEGTNVSEGRGTTLPFQLFGAPFLDQAAFLDRMTDMGLEGVVLRPVCFEPVFDKWRGELCNGFQIHVTEPELFRPYALGLALLELFWDLHGDAFRWLPPPYEYEYEKLPIDILLGDGELRLQIERRESLESMRAMWNENLSRYLESRESCLIYI